MALIGAGPHARRWQILLQTYLNTEIGTIDTAGNLALPAADRFTTVPLRDADIQLWREDREAERVTVVTVPSGSMRPAGLQQWGSGSGQARLDAEHVFAVWVTARAVEASWGRYGAWDRADRVAHGVSAVALKYPTMPVSAQSLDPICLWSAITGWQRADTEDEGDTMAVQLVAALTVRAMDLVT